MTLSLLCGPVRADVAAGQRAFDDGKYDLAESEWREGAARDDPLAEFGLGEVFEQGRGDYRSAEYWYARAAEHGNSAAKYRLALISIAGNRDAAPDPVKAYKWAVLAAAGNAGDQSAVLRRLLDDNLKPEDRAEGRKQAEAWLKRIQGDRDPPPQTSVVAVVPPPSPGPSPAEQLQQALVGIGCASLHGSVSGATVAISGNVPDETERRKLAELAAAVVPGGRSELQVEIVPPPLCQTLAEFDRMHKDGLIARDGMSAALADGGKQLMEGDSIRVEIQGPDHPVNLHIDYFSLDGHVLHMWPTGGELASLGARAKRVFGNPGGKTWDAGGAPFGTEVIAVIATPQPLNFVQTRPSVEQVGEYLPALERALRDARGAGGAEPVLVTTLVHTGPRR